MDVTLIPPLRNILMAHRCNLISQSDAVNVLVAHGLPRSDAHYLTWITRCH